MITHFHQILFLKSPEPGLVKRRLAKAIGVTAATEIYKEMLMSLCEEFPESILFSGGGDPLLVQELTGKAPLEQVGEHLGIRMANAFRYVDESFNDNCPVLLAGTDVPDYSMQHAIEAVQILSATDCVLVDSGDGGYSMIGFSRSVLQSKEFLEIFKNIEWSTDTVLEKQIQNLERLGFTYRITGPLNDIDRIEDLLKYIKRNPGSSFSAYLPGMAVVLPVYNEEESLPKVLSSLTRIFFKHIVVADNGSSDRSRQVAEEFDCEVTLCETKGYGATCLTAIDYLEQFQDWNVILFLDADGSDDPDSIIDVLAPVLNNETDLCCGSRVPVENAALQFHQRMGNKLATFLIRMFWRFRYSDLGPLRAIHRRSLKSLNMDDRNFGWTIQMQIRAIRNGLRVMEVEVPYRRRMAGKSKVSGNIKGSFLAGIIILRTVWRELFLAK